MVRYDFPKLHIFDNDLEDHPTYQFYIYDDRSGLPVFHIIPNHIYADFTIGLFEPKYYHYHCKHAYTLDYPDVLDKVLREPYFRDESKSNWEVMKNIWITMYGARKTYESVENQPDYSKMTNKDIVKRSFIDMVKSKWNA